MSRVVLTKRLTDLKSMSRFSGMALRNQSGGTWCKFLSGGVASDGIKVTKPSDSELFYPSIINGLFDRSEAAKDYRSALDEAGPALDVVQAKRQSDMLSSMQQATRLRYMSRMRHVAAAQSRDLSLAELDIPIVELRLS